MSQARRRREKVFRVIFAVYCAAMLWLLFARGSQRVPQLPYWEQLGDHINLIPLRTISGYWKVVFHRTNDSVLVHSIINLAGNIFLFIPAGYLLPKLWKTQRNFFVFFACCLGALLLVETLQLLFLVGVFDVDDLILNILGMTTGFLIFHAV